MNPLPSGAPLGTMRMYTHTCLFPVPLPPGLLAHTICGFPYLISLHFGFSHPGTCVIPIVQCQYGTVPVEGEADSHFGECLFCCWCQDCTSR